MKWIFIETPVFTRLLPHYMDDEGYRYLQLALQSNPEAGAVMPGTGGFRKLRWQDPRRGKGKRGGIRIIYYVLTEDRHIWLFTLYDKDELSDLAPEEGGNEAGNTVGVGRQETQTMSKNRKLFDEMMSGIDAMRQLREEKITLRTHEVDELPRPEIAPELIRATREQLHVSRAVFARRLRVSTRTLENWEQGRAKPNAQAAALILMVRKYPDTLARLEQLNGEAA